jgi:hypothetical protein
VNRAPVSALRAAAAVFLPVVILAACSGDPAPSPSPSSAPIATLPVASATDLPPTSFGPPPSPTPDDASPLVVDSTLMAYLPTSIGGIDVTEDVDEATSALSDPTLPRIASGVDGAVAVDTGNGNLVYAWIVGLRPGVFTDSDYRQWRDAYDEGACAATGGVVGRAEATIAERQVYVTSCVTGLHAYHVWLEDLDILISASSIGEDRFGEQLLEGIRVPA